MNFLLEKLKDMIETVTVSQLVLIFCLAFIQNISFTVTSRSRNRDNKNYHLWAALFSNSIWFLTFRELIKGDMNLILFIPYCAGTMLGSVRGMSISMFFEKKFGASADAHLKEGK